MRKLLFGIFLLCSLTAFSQKQDSVKTEAWEKIYRASATKINDLVHTKLDVRFDFSKSWMYGKAWITLHPHFYPTDSLCLDAKSMKINEVSVIKDGKQLPLKFSYDSLKLHIHLDRSYKGGENYTVYINYIAEPDSIKPKGSKALSFAKGLNFINPLGTDKTRPTQIWTQGETESNSHWVPTIDKPNQKTTGEISMTVPDKYQTLSNGVMVSQKKNSDGTRTDTWKMTLPHAPYLMMMAVGEFSIIKDSYKGKEVSYYVEKEFAPVARKIFGLTPEMIGFYSRITGLDYPWPKYAQIVCRDFGGAMENTTATIHQESAQQDARQLIDGNEWEWVIAHELFHQWFGDYVTTESWSNLTVNESMADFIESMWAEHKHGKDSGDEQNNNGIQSYLQSGSEKKDLVRFYYKDRENMFDAVSYQKGGCILTMLRNMVGDSAFFKSFGLYLKTKKLQSAEATDLRLAFEEVTGEDLNWFWNQWYFGSGHPKLNINYDYDPAAKTAKVFITQTQPGKVFRFRIAVDLYQGPEKKRNYVWIDKQSDTLLFPAASKPDLINVDGEKILLCEKHDNKTLDNFIFQYTYAGSYADRKEAIDFATGKQGTDPKAFNLIKTALKDRYPNLRIYALQRLNTGSDSIKNVLEPLLADIAKNDPKSLVRAEAISVMGKHKSVSYKPLFLKSINDSSYSIAGNSLTALGAIDSAAALQQAKILSAQKVRGALSDAIDNLLFKYSDESEFDNLAGKFVKLSFGNAKFMILRPFSDFLKRVKNPDNFKKGIDLIVNFRDTIPSQYKQQVLPYLNGMILNGIASSKQTQGMAAQADYVRSKLPGNSGPNVPGIPLETLQKYTGEYNLEGETVKISLTDKKTLNIILSNGSAMDLVPLSKEKFSVKYMDGVTVSFILNDKEEVTDLEMTSPGGQTKAPKKR